MPSANANKGLEQAVTALHVVLTTEEQGRARVEALEERASALRTELAVLESGAERERRHAQELAAAHAGAADALRALRKDVEEQVAARRAEAVRLEEDITRLRSEIEALEGTAADRRATVQTLEREREALQDTIRNLEGEKVRLEGQVTVAGHLAADAERRLQAVREDLQQAEGRLIAAETGLDELVRQKEELERSFRPLRPYAPPAHRLRAATVDVQVNAKLQRHDAMALRLYAEQTGTEIRRVIMDALRNYVPEGVYEAALRMLEAEARQGLEPEFGEDAR